MSETNFDAIFGEYARLCGYVPASGTSTGLSPEQASQQKESLRLRLLEWVKTSSAASNAKAAPAPPRTRAAESVANDVNQQPIALGFLADDLEYFCSSTLEDELREIEMQDHEVNEDAAENKQLADLLEWKQEFTEFVESTMQLPDQNHEKHEEALEKMRRRVPVSAQKLPSAVMYTLLNADADVTTLSMIHDGEKMAVGSEDSRLRVFDLTTTVPAVDEAPHKKRRFEDLDGEGESANGGRFEKDVRGADPSGREGNARTKAGPFPGTCFAGHTKAVTSTSWFAEEGVFLSGSLDGTVRLWSENLKANICVFRSAAVASCPRSRAPVRRLQGTSVSRAGRGRLSGWILFLERSHGPERAAVVHREHGPDSNLQRHGGNVDIVKWHPGCNYFGAALSDGQFHLWDVAAPKVVRIFRQKPLAAGSRVVSCFRFGADGNSVVCGYDDGKLEIFDLRKSTEVMTAIDAHQGPIWSVDCSRGNGNLVATGGEDGCVKLWSLPDRSCVKSYKTRSCKILTTFWTMSNLLITAGVPNKQQ